MNNHNAQAGIPAAGLLEIRIGESPNTLHIDAPANEGYIIGRSDPNSTYLPDIDLMGYDALGLGVSRRHAALVAYQGIVQIIDLNSVNGTFLNNERLPADIPFVIQPGDHIRLGTLNLSLINIQ